MRHALLYDSMTPTRVFMKQRCAIADSDDAGHGGDDDDGDGDGDDEDADADDAADYGDGDHCYDDCDNDGDTDYETGDDGDILIPKSHWKFRLTNMGLTVWMMMMVAYCTRYGKVRIAAN